MGAGRESEPGVMGMQVKPVPPYPEVPPLSEDQVRGITEAVFLPDQEPVPCDVIFVFGSRDVRLWRVAWDAYRRGLGRRIIVTGGVNPAPKTRLASWTFGDTPEARVIAEHLVQAGVPPEALVIEDRSTNSAENVQFSLELFDFARVRSVLFIALSVGAGRQLRTLRKYLPPGVELHPYTFDLLLDDTLPPVNARNWMLQPKSRSFVFGAYLRLAAYSRAGFIDPLEREVAGLEQYVDACME